MSRFTIWLSVFVIALSGWPLTASAKSHRYHRRHHYHYFHFRSPDIDIPPIYTIRGIDISKYQSIIDWDKIREVDSGENQLSFVFIKATDGISKQDIEFKNNWKEARTDGLICGAYHFFHPSQDPYLQAKNFERTVRLEPGDMPPVLDIEVANRQSTRTICRKVTIWLKEIKKKYGVTPIIYTNSHFYKRYLGSSFDEYPLWISDFLSATLPHTQRQWLFWQWSDRMHVQGIDSPVDFNIFNGDTAEFKKILVPPQ